MCQLIGAQKFQLAYLLTESEVKKCSSVLRTVSDWSRGEINKLYLHVSYLNKRTA